MMHGQILIRGPYLTMANQHSITISWRTNLPCGSKVMYGQSPGFFSGGVVNNTPVTDHVVTLSGLAPDTKYYYTVGTNTFLLQGNTSNYFKTLPVTSPLYDKTIRILAVGDVAKGTVFEEQVRDAFLNYIDTNYVDGYLMLGDNAYPVGLDSNFQSGFFNYFQQSVTKHTVLWPALGNHEYANDYTLRQSHAISYFDIFSLPTQGECGGVASHTEMYYSFDIGNVHFVNLDSYGLEEVAGVYYGITDTSDSPQIQWLKQDLDANPLPWVIVSFHHPPYCMGTHNSDVETELVLIRERLNPILERYNVDLILNGHDHTYQRSGFMHQHYGLEPSFDSILHVVQKTSALNDISAFSCPIVKNSVPPVPSDSGLLYLVIGSGSDNLSAPQAAWPHNAMYYSNNTQHGSLLLTIEGNRLIGEWISTDTNQVVKDQFTIYKHVNRRNHLTVLSGQLTTLSASWQKENDYVWSTGDSTREINASFTSAQVLYVSDKKGCITDSFLISIAAPLSAQTESLPEFEVSPNPAGEALTLRNLEEGTYALTLSTEGGHVILRKEFVLVKGSKSHTLAVRQLPGGVYLLSCAKYNEKTWTRRIVIAH